MSNLEDIGLKLQAQIESEASRAEADRNKAKQFVREGRDDLAREALGRAADADQNRKAALLQLKTITSTKTELNRLPSAVAPPAPASAPQTGQTVPTKATQSTLNLIGRPPPTRTKKRKRLTKPATAAVWTSIAVVIFFAILLVIQVNSKRPYNVTNVEYQSTDSQEIQVTWTVQNVGSHSGTPMCNISANSPGDADTGFDVFTANNPIRPGGKRNAVDYLTITNDGADLVSNVSVAC